MTKMAKLPNAYIVIEIGGILMISKLENATVERKANEIDVTSLDFRCSEFVGRPWISVEANVSKTTSISNHKRVRKALSILRGMMRGEVK